MRIALLPTPNLSCETGSTIHALLLARGLAARGHDVHVFAKDHPEGAPHAKFHDLPLTLVHPTLVDRPISDESLWNCVNTLTTAVLEEHGRSRFDVVHAHYATVTGFAALMVHVISGAPFAVSCFGRDLNIGARQDKRYFRMVCRVVEDAAAVIAADDGIAVLLAQNYGVDESRLFAVPMGVDEGLFRPPAQLSERPGGSIGGKPRLLNISSCFTPEKGLETLLRSACELWKAGHDIGVVIAGDDDHDEKMHLRKLKGLVGDLGLNERVTFLGRVAHFDIPALLAACDVFVDTRTVGNFSSATLEALFVAPYVIASDVPGNRVWITPGENGLLFRSGDPVDLTRKLSDLFADESMRIGLQGGRHEWRRREGAKWGDTSMIDRLTAIYRELC